MRRSGGVRSMLIVHAAMEWLPHTSTAFATTGSSNPSPPIRVGGVHHLMPDGSSQVKVAVTSPTYQPCALGNEENDTVIVGGSTSSVTTEFAERSEEHTSELHALAYLVCR